MKRKRSNLFNDVLVFLAEFIQERDHSIRVPREAAMRGLYYLSNLTKTTAMGFRDNEVLRGPLIKAESMHYAYEQFIHQSAGEAETARKLREFTRHYLTICDKMGIHLQEEEQLLSDAGNYIQQNERFESM